MGFVKEPGYGRQHIRVGFSDIPVQVERRRSDILRRDELSVTEHIVKGVSQINGTGEGFITVKFPVYFVERPVFTFGAELVEGSPLEEGNFPLISAIVSGWDIYEPDREIYGAPLRIHYRSAKMAVVMTGPSYQSIFLHWTFTGLAVVSPTGGGSSADTSGGTI